MPLEFYSSYFPTVSYSVTAANSHIAWHKKINNSNTTNFLLEFNLRVMILRWKGDQELVVILNLFAGCRTGIINRLAPKMIVFSTVCDWNLIVTSSVEPFNKPSYVTQVGLTSEDKMDILFYFIIFGSLLLNFSTFFVRWF
ncbi:MAG: hypothetical protein Ta2E_10410 [Mycoplasmoidaceae bacterium]|nr:MAG: hypothetical protein Ta2E_10410 [Mycoplasmoidaceae bacterium]